MTPPLLLKKIKNKLLLSFIGTITHVITDEPVAALTFDDGPNPEATPRILEILKKYNARGSFFVVGESASKYPEIISEMTREGHFIGNHTWSHISLPSLTGAERRKQIRQCRDVLPDNMKLLRPPYGHQTLSTRIDALMLGYRVVCWNLHPYDWEDRKPEWMATWLKSKITPGSIILLHDALRNSSGVNMDRTKTLLALDMFLCDMSNSFRFVTLPELLRNGKVCKKIWFVKDENAWIKRKGNNR